VSSGAIKFSMLKTLLMQCLDEVASLGLDCKAVICDLGSNNRPVFQSLLCVNVVKPHFVRKCVGSIL
jgi:hypothetical protein